MEPPKSAKSNHRKKILTFLLLTIVFSLPFYFLILSGRGESQVGNMFTLGLMWSPGISAIITNLIYDRSLRGLGWKPKKPFFLVLAYLLPLLYAGSVYGMVWLTRIAPFTTENIPEGYSLPVFIILNATLFFLISILSALGEEIGWRGLLVPQLAKEYNFSMTAVVSGSIWALWHFPLIIFGSYNSGSDLPVSLASFFLLVIGASLMMAWLTIRTGSLWPAVILHASHNVFIQNMFDPLTAQTYWGVRITTEFGVGLAFTSLIAGYIFWRLRKRLPMSYQWSENELLDRLGEM
jgi:membrane protease YdiL (CAAX protease family)